MEGYDQEMTRGMHSNVRAGGNFLQDLIQRFPADQVLCCTFQSPQSALSRFRLAGRGLIGASEAEFTQ